MIDTTREQLLLLRDVPGYLERRGFGKRVHASAVYRWVQCGTQGVRLEAVKIGGTLVTSAEAIQRWVEARHVQDGLSTAAAAPFAASLSPIVRRREDVHRQLVEYRVVPTELDKVLSTLNEFSASTRAHVGHALFRAGFRNRDDVRRTSRDELLRLPAIGTTSRPIVWALKTRLDADLRGQSP